RARHATLVVRSPDPDRAAQHAGGRTEGPHCQGNARMDWLLIRDILIVLLLLVAGGLLSGAGIAVISANRSFLVQRADAGNSSARLALELAQNPNRLVPPVQAAMSLLATFAAVLGGVAVAGRIEEQLAERSAGLIFTLRAEIALTIVALVLSFVS